MTDIDARREIGALTARCMILEARVAALAAFACAVLKGEVNRDITQTRWGEYLGPALEQFSRLGDDETTFAAGLPGWVAHKLQRDSG